MIKNLSFFLLQLQHNLLQLLPLPPLFLSLNAGSVFEVGSSQLFLFLIPEPPIFLTIYQFVDLVVCQFCSVLLSLLYSFVALHFGVFSP